MRAAWSILEAVPFLDNWHIGALCEHLQAVTRGEIPKLLVNIPPGCSKSLLVSVFWPMWEWAKDPSLRWFCASYDQRLSTRDSVRCRVLLSSDWYQAHWGDKVRLKGDQNQKTYYETDRGGYRLATSIGGHGTGEHPDRIVCDDANDVQGSESEAERLSVHEWWDLTMTTRGVSRAARRVIIQQRTHELDLSGHVLDQGGYVHLCLPMRYEVGRMATTPLGWNDPRTEEGKLLAPRQFSEETVRGLERSLGAYGTAGQLQQRPAPREGGMFKREWFEVVAALPAKVQRVRYWDKAGTAGGGDYTVGVLMAKDTDGLFYVEDVVRGQWSAGQRNPIIKQTAQLDRQRYGHLKTFLEREGGSGGKESGEISVRDLAGYAVETEQVTGTKEARAEPFANQCEAHNVKLLAADWNKEYLDELTVFPNGKHDDMVDASSGAFNKLALGPYKRFWIA